MLISPTPRSKCIGSLLGVMVYKTTASDAASYKVIIPEKFSSFSPHSLNIVVAGGVGGYFFIFKDTEMYGNAFGIVGWDKTEISFLGNFNNGTWNWAN